MKSKAHKRGGLGQALSGRARLIALFATAAAFLLVPVGQAFAFEAPMSLTISGGPGEVTSGEEGLGSGSPTIACSFDGKTQSGTCANQMNEEYEEEFGEGPFEWLNAEGAIGWTLSGATILFGCKPESGFCFFQAKSEEEVEIGVEFPAAPVEGPPLTVLIEEGSGTVTGPGGFECTGTAPHECTTTSIEAGAVSLKASPEIPGNVFKGWGGCATHVGLTCGLTLSETSKPIKVKFTPTSSLSIEKTGSGSGKASATGISCDESCSSGESEIPNGKTVKVKTKAAKGSKAAVLTGTGSASSCTGLAECEFTISADSTLEAEFAAIPMKTLTVNLTGPAYNKGKVKGKATVKGLLSSAISCGSGCTTTTESFFSTDSVTLEASAATGYTFAGWSGGGCSGSSPTCVVATSSDKTVNAEFE